LKKASEKFIAFNELTKKFEEVDQESELPIGQTLIKLFYIESVYQWVTIPGASSYVVAADLSWVEVAE
jgi:hypothetical protein